VDAAAKLLGLLRRMEEKGALSDLPEELAAIARLRLTYPEASLTQLAALTTPPLTKSGVNHRLQKLTELLEKKELAFASRRMEHAAFIKIQKAR
jgi:DNA-binding protein WhiA